jgi:hypothetical protein
MSERTAPSLSKLDELLPVIKSLPSAPNHAQLVEETEALRRAVAAFHMEAIRFRMHAVDRFVSATGDASAKRIFEELRQALEAAGFHTRSHSAPEARNSSQGS